MVPPQSSPSVLELRGKPVQSRRGPATVTGDLLEYEGRLEKAAAAGQDFGSQIPAAEEEQTLSVEKATPPRFLGAPTRFDHSTVRPGSS